MLFQHWGMFPCLGMRLGGSRDVTSGEGPGRETFLFPEEALKRTVGTRGPGSGRVAPLAFEKC